MVFKQFEHTREIGGVVLQVAVDGQQKVAFGAQQPRHQRGGLPQVGRHRDDAHAHPFGGAPQHGRTRAVGAAVIDEKHLGMIRVEMCKHSGHRAEQEGDVLFLVVTRDNDAYELAHAAVPWCAPENPA